MQFIDLIDTHSNQLDQKDFNQSCKIWSGFDIVAQMANINSGPKDYPSILVSGSLIILSSFRIFVYLISHWMFHTFGFVPN